LKQSSWNSLPKEKRRKRKKTMGEGGGREEMEEEDIIGWRMCKRTIR